jgi:hypothetical protein
VLPLTHAAWSPCGVVIEATSDVKSLPSNIKVKTNTSNHLPVSFTILIHILTEGLLLTPLISIDTRTDSQNFPGNPCLLKTLKLHLRECGIPKKTTTDDECQLSRRNCISEKRDLRDDEINPHTNHQFNIVSDVILNIQTSI